MRIGHLDGKGTVYDERGLPIMESGETVLYTVPRDNMDVSEGSTFWNMRVIFPSTPEKGELYLTDRRMVFIRKPDPALAWGRYNYPGGIPDAIADSYKALELNRRNAREFCIIDYGEIEGFWVDRRTSAVVYLRSQPAVTRKALLYRRGSEDRKLVWLKDLLVERLPVTLPENTKGSFGLGLKYPFLRRGRKGKQKPDRSKLLSP